MGGVESTTCKTVWLQWMLQCCKEPLAAIHLPEHSGVLRDYEPLSRSLEKTNERFREQWKNELARVAAAD
jgi:hypothetical protein